jgi:hypothetical protein
LFKFQIKKLNEDNNGHKEAVKKDLFTSIKPPQWKLDLMEKRRKSEHVKVKKNDLDKMEVNNKPPWLNELKTSVFYLKHL